jgi:hypothetical protein
MLLVVRIIHSTLSFWGEVYEQNNSSLNTTGNEEGT